MKALEKEKQEPQSASINLAEAIFTPSREEKVLLITKEVVI